MKIDYFIPLAKPHIGEEEIATAVEVLRSGWWTTGPKVNEFEEKLSNYLSKDTKIHVLGVNSCTSALFLSLLALGIGKGDEVIVPTWTFAATAQVVEWTGATLRLCDVNQESLNLDVAHAESLITNRTKAIIPVHIAGYPCDMERIGALATKHSLLVIEDAAHAIGTKFYDQRIGNFSDLTCFSFYATKNLAMGEGGAVVSKDEALIEKIRKLSYFGIDKEAFGRYEKRGQWFYDIEGLGYKCNLDSVHAALGIVQLEKLEWMNERRREIAQQYKSGLSSKIAYTMDSSDHYHTFHLFPIILPENVNRDTFIERLKENNIGSSVHFVPLHMHSYYKERFESDIFKSANAIYPRIVSIPMCPSLNENEVLYIIETINTIVE